jgi:hypothetical protein
MVIIRCHLDKIDPDDGAALGQTIQKFQDLIIEKPTM